MSTQKPEEQKPFPVKLFFDQKDLRVPHLGVIRVSFRNDQDCRVAFAATIQSMRFDILEAANGEFPTRQYATWLEPGEQGSFTIADRPQKVSDKELAVYCSSYFNEGEIEFKVGFNFKMWTYLSWQFGRTNCKNPNPHLDETARTSYVKVLREKFWGDRDWKKPSKYRWDLTYYVTLQNDTKNYQKMRRRIKAENKKWAERYCYKQRTDFGYEQEPEESKEPKK